MAKKSIKEEIREILAEDFVGPPLPEQGMASPFAADYVNAPPGYESAPTEILTGFPPIPYQSSDEFHPPPTISNEEQEIIDSGKDDLSRAIMRALQESKKGDK